MHVPKNDNDHFHVLYFWVDKIVYNLCTLTSNNVGTQNQQLDTKIGNEKYEKVTIVLNKTTLWKRAKNTQIMVY